MLTACPATAEPTERHPPQQPVREASLKSRLALRLLLVLPLVAALMFAPAGSFGFWQGWMCVGIFVALSATLVTYFYRRDPGLLFNLDCPGRVIEDGLGRPYLDGGWRVRIDQRTIELGCGPTVLCPGYPPDAKEQTSTRKKDRIAVSPGIAGRASRYLLPSTASIATRIRICGVIWITPTSTPGWNRPSRMPWPLSTGGASCRRGLPPQSGNPTRRLAGALVPGMRSAALLAAGCQKRLPPSA
jgi:hypothetical protein